MSHDVVIPRRLHGRHRAPRPNGCRGWARRSAARPLRWVPEGKGSNQAVAAAQAGADVGFISRLGTDAFADMALKLWAEAGVTPLVTQHAEHPTGSAFIFIDDATGDNAIIISPGVAGTISPADVERWAAKSRRRESSSPSWSSRWTWRKRRWALPAMRVSQRSSTLRLRQTSRTPCSALCDYVTPNETEAQALERHRRDGCIERGARPGASCRGALRRPVS
jgi:ribokinase